MSKMNLAELREDRELAVKEMQAMADTAQSDGRSFTKEELVRYDELDSTQQKLEQQIATIERADKLRNLTEKKSEVYGAPTIKIKRKATNSDYHSAFQAWALGGEQTRKRVRDEWKRSADMLDIDYESNRWICRDQSSDTENEGQEFLNDSMYKGHVEAKKYFGGMFEAANVIPVASAESYHYAVDDDTASAAAVHAQLTPVSNVSIAPDRVTITPALYSSGVFPISIQLIRDSRTDIGSWVARKLSRRILSKANTVLTAALYTGTVAGTTGVSNDLTDDDLYDLYFSVDREYRNSPRTKWMLNDTTLAHLISVLKDNTGQPTWGSGLRSSPEDSIMQKGIVVNNDCDSMSVGVAKHPIVFGDFDNFIVHTVGAAPEYHRLNELYMGSLAVGFIAHWELAGSVVDAGTNPLKTLATGSPS